MALATGVIGVSLVWGCDIYMSLWMHGFDISWHQRAGQIDIYMSVLGHNMSYVSSRQGEGAGEGGALEGREGRSRSGCCAQSVRRTPRCVPCARRSPAPPPRRSVRSFWGGIRCLLFQGVAVLGIHWRPGPGGAAHCGMVLMGTLWVHSVLGAVPGGLQSTFAGVSQVRIT